ncbi:MAG: hypothetical protein M4D80_14050 [Myxococcota bacterium]|nr:hypothetical protein [Myxococcota bacterium]
MKLFLSIAFLNVALIALATSSEAGDACKRGNFETELVKSACTTGGVGAAKDAMKKFVKETKSKHAGLECKTCHSKMAPSYELKADGLSLYRKLGGK